ncbi:MAG: hypothetical protein QW680_14020, partial [Pyrobaculum sp.]
MGSLASRGAVVVKKRGGEVEKVTSDRIWILTSGVLQKPSDIYVSTSRLVTEHIYVLTKAA